MESGVDSTAVDMKQHSPMSANDSGYKEESHVEAGEAHNNDEDDMANGKT